MNDAPLILTLTLDDATQRFFDALRTRYFPPERNYLAAHCTLFHHLPAEHEAEIRAHLASIAAEVSMLPLAIGSPRSIGRGVIFPLENKDMAGIHRGLQAHWHTWLTPQDRQGLRPHVTVQNKVSSAIARETLEALSRESFVRPESGYGVGFSLFYYRDGPWEATAQFSFAGAGVSPEPSPNSRAE